MNRGRRLVAALAVIIVIGLALTLSGVVQVTAPKPQVFLETKSPDGKRTAHLDRSGGGDAPIYYSVVVTGAGVDCTAATLTGAEAERWVRLSWDAYALVVRYALPDDAETKATAPASKRGGDACHGMTVRVIEDKSLGDAIRPVGNGQ